MSALSPGDFAGAGTHKPAQLRCAWAQVGPCKGWLLRAGLVGLLALEPLLCSAETTAVKQQPGPATLPGKTPRSESAASASVAATPGGKVDGGGMAYFKTPLKNYTLNLQGSEPP
ncbi:hypothetical protein NJH78_21455 [Pseudomonas chlororaphis]|uniref:hypothetical protein n=1 Tax=Pseudomonas chlororaphis TaxID=587753 RepID=UPI00209AAAE3|nr:hypothetical protein [Pseudomonas chlororaphis]MCO7572560.1 hypothetical protein [Pseudomonas chlororaphis]MCO7590596.1 hypothetical protein [Pseudomonas chlororaphis]MCO7612964.1 hypothetical protein [Pseudomonas chlororaphis]